RRTEGLEAAHRLQRDLAQLPQVRRLVLALVQRLILAQRLFDLRVVRQEVGIGEAGLPRRFPLRRGKVRHAVDRDETRGLVGELPAQVGVAARALLGHGGRQKIWLRTSSGGRLESRAQAPSSPIGGCDSWMKNSVVLLCP